MSHFLGFDGGGTKTECVVMDSAGELIAQALGGPSNSSRIGVHAAVRNVAATADAALDMARLRRGDVSAIAAALAGTADPERRARVRAGLRAEFPYAHVVMMTDLDASLAAAPEGAAIVLVAGTGSAAIGRNANREIVRVGGYGRFSSDEGSAFDVGRRTLGAVMAQHENNRQSPMGSDILRFLHCASWEDVQERAQTAPDDVYPAIFPLIAAAADAGEGLARDELRASAHKLCLLTLEAATQLGLADTEFAMVKTGGMLGRSKFFDAQLAEAFAKHLPHAREARLRMSPAHAAALAARDAHE